MNIWERQRCDKERYQALYPSGTRLELISMKVIQLGDNCHFKVPNDVFDCTELNYFDELEHDCWNLVLKYAEPFRMKMVEAEENNTISFDTAKAIQDKVLEQFEDAGAQFNYREEMNEVENIKEEIIER